MGLARVLGLRGYIFTWTLSCITDAVFNIGCVRCVGLEERRSLVGHIILYRQQYARRIRVKSILRAWNSPNGVYGGSSSSKQDGGRNEFFMSTAPQINESLLAVAEWRRQAIADHVCLRARLACGPAIWHNAEKITRSLYSVGRVF